MPKGTQISVSYHAQSGRYRKYIGSQIGRDGKLRPKCWYFGGDRREAETKALALMADWEDLRRRGAVSWPTDDAQTAQEGPEGYDEVNASDLTFEDICKLWIERLDRLVASGQRSSYTVSSYRHRLARLYDALPKNTKLIDLEADRIEQAVLHFAGRPSQLPQPQCANIGKRLSPKTVQSYITQLKTILKYAHEIEAWDKPRRFDAMFSIGYRRMLAQAEEDSPLLTGEVKTFSLDELTTIWRVIPGYTLYTCSSFVRLEDAWVVHVATDIDNRDHLSNDQSPEATQTRADLERLLRAAGIPYVVQPSTSNCGYHLHLVLSFPLSMSRDAVYGALTRLRTAISARYETSGCHEVCLKGLPFRIANEVDDIKFGTLVRSPLPKSGLEARGMLKLFEEPIDHERVMAVFGADARGTSGSDGVGDMREGASSPLEGRGESEALDLSGDGDAHSHNTRAPSLSVIGQGRHFERNVSHLTWNGVRSVGDANKRMIRAALLMEKEQGHLPTPLALVKSYEEHDLHSPQNDNASTPSTRLSRAEEALKYLRLQPSRYVPVPNNTAFVRAWTERFREMDLPAEQLRYGSRGRRIRPEHLGLVMGLVDRRIALSQPGTPKTLLIKASRIMAEAGDCSHRLDNTLVAKARELLVELGLLRIDAMAAIGRATLYGRGKRYDELKPEISGDADDGREGRPELG